MKPVRIRPSVDADLPAITAIYGHFVLHGSGSFEETPPSEAEMARRRASVLASGMPYVVATLDDALVGYAYATVYRDRSAYRFTAEDSIYVHTDHGNAGIGSALLGALIEVCEARGCRQMVAIIGDSANVSSIRLHERLGFEHAGELKSVGFKFGRWMNTTRMQRTLGAGDATPPVEQARRKV